MSLVLCRDQWFQRRGFAFWITLGLIFLFLGGVLEIWALYSANSPVVQLDTDNFHRLVLDSSETWLVEFYAPWCGHCRNFAPVWEKAARRLEGLVRVGAVDGDQHRALAQEYGVQAFPTIKLFSGRKGTKNRQMPTDYKGGRRLKDIVGFARRSLIGYVHTVELSGVDAFLGEEPTKAHILLVTTSQGKSRIYRALSERYVDRAVFGVLRVAAEDDSSVKAFFQRFGAQPRTPTLLGVPAGAEQDPSMALILSERERMGAHALDAFVKRVLTKEIPSMTSRSSAASKTSETRKRQPSEARATTPQHGSSWGDFLGPECAENSKARFCVVLAQRNSSSLVEALSEKYLHDGVHFVEIQERVLRQHLRLPPNALAFLIRTRKQRVAVLEMVATSTTPLQEQISVFVDRALGGDLLYRPLSELLKHGEDKEKDEL
ncbi:hypothetical protein CCYA_CCYA08G2413 [Cyanidiococcus yangmingshanensis]|nr:hypothetical protein CCYA_CCYA08G2413 [Cyanidiococcus yangmingshanensis]